MKRTINPHHSQRLLNARSAFAAVLLGTLLVAAIAQARPTHRHQAPRLIGYKVIVEPQIAEQPRGRLLTEALHWQLRAVYLTAEGGEILVRPTVPPKFAENPRDNRVRVQRPWESSDFRRESRVFRKLKRALRRFDGLRRSPDITLLGPGVPDDPGPAPVVTAPPHSHVQAPPPVQPPPLPPMPSCEQTLIDKGFPPMYLDECKGVDPVCAVTLLEKGHHPQQLSNCRGVERRCAVQLLEAGHHPMHLDKCTPNLSPGCTEVLLQMGYHPMQLESCAGVDDRCAVSLLRAGHHPMHLEKCR